jgi:hypothetical protein
MAVRDSPERLAKDATENRFPTIAGARPCRPPRLRDGRLLKPPQARGALLH